MGLQKSVETYVCSYLIWVQCEVCVQQLASVVVRLTLIDFVGGVPDLHIHGPVGHPLVLEALGPTGSDSSRVTLS